MEFFMESEFKEKYKKYSNLDFEGYEIEAVSEMIFSQIGLRFRDSSWNDVTVPSSIKKASMEQMRFMLEHDIPFVDTNNINAGEMGANINTDYSTLSLRILANEGFAYRGNPINYNMGLQMPFGDD